MFLAEQMDRISLVVFKDDMDAVLTEVARLGVLHPATLDDFGDWTSELASTPTDQAVAEYTKRRSRIQQLMADAPQPFRSDNYDFRSLPMALGDIDRVVDSVEANIRALRDAYAALLNKKEIVSALQAQHVELGDAAAMLPDLAQSTLLTTAIGTLPSANSAELERQLAELPAVILIYRNDGERAAAICIALQRAQAEFDALLHDAGFEATAQHIDPQSFPSDSTCAETLESQLAQSAQELHKAQSAALPELLNVSHSVEHALLLLQARTLCRTTDKTQIVTGWAPRARSDEICAALKRRFHDTILIDSATALSFAGNRSSIDIPVLFRRSRLLAPFTLLLAGFGTPAYHMIDPALFSAFAFLVMFGMMFGDIGHGLVLVLGGIALARSSFERRGIGTLVVYCGLSSMAFGALYGSIFGVEDVIPALWIRPLHNLNALFAVAIGFGILLISIGLILHSINAARSHRFIESIFDEHGLLAALAYWTGIGLACAVALAPGKVSMATFGIVAIPLAILFARGPVLLALGEQDKACPDGVLSYVMESLVKTLDIVTGFLANTVSFIRVAAFGIAHAALFVAIFCIADALSSGPGSTLVTWIVLFLGNAIVIGLEGMVVTIQAVRLEYYEFFGKFFTQQGTTYQPMCLPGASAKVK